MSKKKHEPNEPGGDATEGWEALEEEASVGSLDPSPELEEALREASEAVAARKAPPTSGMKVQGRLPSAENEELRAELEAEKDKLVRLTADFDNHRRRTLRDREEAHRYGHENIVKDVLGTVDNLERAIGHAQGSGGGDFESMLQGVELVRRELLGALAHHGVEPIEADGEAFDPEVHEAMAQKEDDSVPVNTVVEVFQKGYRLRDRLIRPARVVVSAGGPPRAGSEASGEEAE